MSFFTVQVLQEKLNRLTLSQDSIETLSLWIIHHKAHATTSVEVWMEDMQSANADRRLMLFYLANDVLQNSRRRGANMFQDLFRDPLRQAVTLVRGQKIQTSVERMFRIWKDRRVYDNSFLKELEQLIEPARQSQAPSQLTGPSFKLSLLEDALTEFRKFEAELKVKSAHLKNLRVDVSNPTASLSQLKDKSEGGRVSAEFDEASQKLQDYSECLGIEVNERINVLDILKDCEDYQTQCLVEGQKTSSDYKQLEKKAMELKSKLDTRIKELERAQSTATSDPTAKEDITDVGDMEIESDNETQDSLPLPSLLPTAQPTAAHAMQPPPAMGGTGQPPAIATATFQQQLTQQSQQLLQPKSSTLVAPPPSAPPSSYQLPPPRVPQQLPAANATILSTIPGPGRSSGVAAGGGGFSNLNTPPSSSLPPRPPLPTNQPYAPPPPTQPHPPPPAQVLRQPPPPRSNFPPSSSSIPPGSTIPPRYQRPSFPPPTGVRPSSNMSLRPPLPANFSGPPLPARPRYPPPPPGSSMNIRQSLPPQRGVPYTDNNNTNGPRPSFPPPSSLATQANHSPSSAPPPQLTTPLRNSSPTTSVGPPNTTNALVMVQQPISLKSTTDISEDTAGEDSIDLQTRNQTGLDQRLKNMVAQRMFGGVLNEYGDASSDGDEKPYSPASDQPEITISNTGTPKAEDDNDDDDQESIPTPDSGTESPDDEEEEGASPRMNMNNPILQALYNSSPDTNDKSDVQPDPIREEVPPSDVSVPPDLNIDTQFLKGILDTVRSTSSPFTQETATPEPIPQGDFESPEIVAIAPNKAPNLAAIKDIKITPTVTNLLGELFPQLSKTLQQNKKRKQEGSEDEMAVKVPRIEEPRDFASRAMADEPHSYSDTRPPAPIPSMTGPGARPPHPNSIPPPRPGMGMGQFPPRPGMRPPRPGMGPPRPAMGAPRPGMRPPHPGMRPPRPGPMPRGMLPPTRGQFPPPSPTNSPRSGPFPPGFRGPPPPSFRGPPPSPRGPAPAMRHPGPPPPPPPSQGQQVAGNKPIVRAPPYPPRPGAAMVPNHTGPIPPGAYPPAPRAPINHANVTVQQSGSGDSRVTDSIQPPHQPFQGSGSFRPPRYV